MRDIGKGISRDRLESMRSALRVRRRNVIRAGLGVVIALLVFSTIKAYDIQESLTEETIGIHQRHVRQDDLLWQLRRNLWLGANASRDYLLNPNADRNQKFAIQLAELKKTSNEFLEKLGRESGGSAPPRELKVNIESYWAALAGIPAATHGLDAFDRYEFVQGEITTRRVTVSNLVREFTELAQQTLRDSEADLVRSRRDAATRLLWVLGLSLVIALAVSGFSVLHSERLERQAGEQYEEVERARMELRQFAGRLMQIQEEERTRLSRELHDEIGQALATMQLEVARAESLSALARPEIRERLAHAGELARRTVQTVRDISALLRPSLLDDLGLAPALEWQVETFTRRTGVPCELHIEGLSDSLPDPGRTCVYRVIQESLHNCEKYASASRVTVTIARAARILTVTVCDDGVGFDVAAYKRDRPTERFGILGMQERAAAMSGTLEVRSELGAGVAVILQIPLAEVVPDPLPMALEVRA